MAIADETPVILDEAKAALLASLRAKTDGSRRAHSNAVPLLPGGVNRNIVYQEPYPLFSARAQGSYIEDVDGNRYLDMLGNYTSMILGHNHPLIVRAVREQLDRGTAWAAASVGEADLAQLIVQRIPSIDQIRFTSSGTEATLIAMRAARAFTGRALIARFEGAYHGFHDYAVAAGRYNGDPSNAIARQTALGIPPAVNDSILVLPFNDIGQVEAAIASHGRDLAGVIVEPVMGVAGVIRPDPGFLPRLREITADNGTVLVFDEVMTLRLGYGGAQELFMVEPDLTTLGKIIGGGFPVGAVGGRRDIMSLFAPSADGAPVPLSGTFHANPITLAAGIATLTILTREEVTSLNARGSDMVSRLRRLFAASKHPLQVTSVGSLFHIHCNAATISDFRSSARGDRDTVRWIQLALLEQGILMGPRGVGCLATSMDAEQVDEYCEGFAKALESLGLL